MRTSCDECVRRIARGDRSRLAQNAGWTRTTPQGREYYCQEDAVHLKIEDEKEAARWSGRTT